MRFRAFTIIELIFVIIVLGILAVVALPKFTGVLEQADIANAKSKVSAIRSGLQVYKNKHVLLGKSPYPDSLDSDANHLFDQVLPTAVTPSTKRGGWKRDTSDATKYRYYLTDDKYLLFKYDKTKGTFECDSGGSTVDDAATICDNF